MKTSVGSVKAAGFTIVELPIYSNLHQIESAKAQWAVDNHKNTGDDVGDLAQLGGYLRGGTVRDAIREIYTPNPISTAAEASLPSVQLGRLPQGAAIPRSAIKRQT